MNLGAMTGTVALAKTIIAEEKPPVVQPKDSQ
jgi:hypothetical protein